MCLHRPVLRAHALLACPPRRWWPPCTRRRPTPRCCGARWRRCGGSMPSGPLGPSRCGLSLACWRGWLAVLPKRAALCIWVAWAHACGVTLTAAPSPLPAPPWQVAVLGPDGRKHRLSRYYAAWDQPRPESHRWVATWLRSGRGGGRWQGQRRCRTGRAPRLVAAWRAQRCLQNRKERNCIGDLPLGGLTLSPHLQGGCCHGRGAGRGGGAAAVA